MKRISILLLAVILLQSCRKNIEVQPETQEKPLLENSFIINGGKFKNQLIIINGTNKAVYYANFNFPFTDIRITNDSADLHILFDLDKRRAFNTAIHACYPDKGYLSIFLPHIGLETDNSGSTVYNFDVEVKRYDKEGGYVEGTFHGNFRPYNDTTVYYINNGRFSALRENNQ